MTEPVLTAERIRLSGGARTRDDAIREVGALLVDAGAVEPVYVDSMFERERTVSTYMGNLLAIPHGTNDAKDAIRRSALAFVRYDAPIDWDGNEVRFALGIAGRGDEHLGILSSIALVFSDESEVARLLAAATESEVLELLGSVNAG